MLRESKIDEMFEYLDAVANSVETEKAEEKSATSDRTQENNEKEKNDQYPRDMITKPRMTYHLYTIYSMLITKAKKNPKEKEQTCQRTNERIKMKNRCKNSHLIEHIK